MGRFSILKGRLGRIAGAELSRRLYLVVSGEMRLIQATPDGQECLMERIGAGEFFCLSSFISGHACSGEMVSSGMTEICSWPREKIRNLLLEDRHFHHNLLQRMASQLEQERALRTLSRCCRAEVKVAAYLLRRIKNDPGCRPCEDCLIDLRPIGITAQELGIARETFTRALQRLVGTQGISYQRGQVKITDMESLEAVLHEEECQCRCV